MPTSILLTPTNMLENARKYSFLPGNEAAGYTAANVTPLDGSYAGFNHTVVDNTQDVTMMNINQLAIPGSGGRGTSYTVSHSRVAGATGTPCFFLPWDHRGAAVEMTIPRFVAGGDQVANPPLFFTACLSGCSIMFKGSPGHPTIVHCGTAGATGGEAATVGESNQFFRAMMSDIRAKGLGRARKTVKAQVLSTDYMNKGGPGGVGVASADETAFKNKMIHHYAGELQIEDVTMWGCIFGFRTGTHWEFWLQENATIVYRAVADIEAGYLRQQAGGAVAPAKKARWNPFKKQAPVQLPQTPPPFDVTTLTEAEIRNSTPGKVHSRPAVVTRVFPGAAHAGITNKWRSLPR